MKRLLLLIMLVSFLASCGGGSEALFGDGPEHLQPAQQSTYDSINPEPTTLDIKASSSQIYFYDDQIPYEWIDATRGINTGLTGDDRCTQIPIGFDFEFYGVTYNSVYVSTNGFITFKESGCTSHSNQPIPGINPPNYFIAPFWDDLVVGSDSAVYYLLEGTAPNRRLTIQWHNVAHYGHRSGTITFQVTLYEGSNNIIFRYQDVIFGHSSYDRGASATVGIEGDGTVGLQYSYNEPRLRNEMAILFYYRTHTLTVTKQGTGSGTVTSEPAGIDCGQTCSANFAVGREVALRAEADQDSAFVG